MTETLMLELFAQIDDPDHDRLSITLSDDQITLQPADGARFWISRQSFNRIADLVRRRDAALETVGCLENCNIVPTSRNAG